MLSGLKSRSLRLNTLGTMSSPASSQFVQVGRPSTSSLVQPVLSKVNVTCPRPQRNVHRPGFELRTPWSEIRRPNHCATPPPRSNHGDKNSEQISEWSLHIHNASDAYRTEKIRLNWSNHRIGGNVFLSHEGQGHVTAPW